MDGKCNVILNGTVLDGYNYPLVVDQLSKLFKMDKQKAASLLDSKKHIIKKEIDSETAEKYKRAFMTIGASCDIEMVRSIKLDIDFPPELKIDSSSLSQEPVTVSHMYCSGCGGKLQTNANYCHICGMSVHQKNSKSTAFISEPNYSELSSSSKLNESSRPRAITSIEQKLSYLGFALLPFKNYATFTGRSRRKEYWSFFLLILLSQLCISFTFGFAQGFIVSFTHGQMGYGISQWGNVISSIFNLGIMVPAIAVGVRRLHDTNRSGWWLLLPIVNFIMLALDGDKSINRYGPAIVK